MRWLRWFFIGLAGLCLITALGLSLGLWYTLDYVRTAPVDDPPTSLLSLADAPQPAAQATPRWLQTARADREGPISLTSFTQPAQRFGPWTRWWWPANLVQQKELERELTIFSDIGLAGVEIQPFNISLSEQDMAASRAQAGSWDTPMFYANLRFALNKAKTLGLEVDLNNGSGWPTGGPHVALDDGLRQLVHSELIVGGPSQISQPLPAPQMPLAAFMAGAVGMLGDSPMQVFDPKARALVAVVAAKITQNERSPMPWQLEDQITLDADTLVDITAHVHLEQVTWTVPPGNWAIVALWEMPGGELITGGYAHATPGYVVDHLDSERMRANQNYLFRSETGLAEHFGQPLRAFFNDSLEFRLERHWGRGQLEAFESRKGYDPRTWLPALIEPGADQMPFHALNVATRGEYDLGDSGARFVEDWLQVTSALFRERYLKTMTEWGSERGLAHRLQAYGGPIAVVSAAGESDIPEAEQLYAGGSEMFLKAVSSGAYAADKPIVSAESFIFVGSAFMSTPLKVKALADKAFAAGINQLVFHGSAYQLDEHKARGYPEQDGWYPWQLGLLSMDFSEQWEYWSHAPALTAYMARSQYLLRKGRPEVDVLVYYPMLGFPQGYSNPSEPLDQGRFPGEHYPDSEDSAADGRGVQWMRATWRATRDLEQAGLTWAWADEQMLLNARYAEGVLQAGALQSQGLLLPNVEAMHPNLAEHIAHLVSIGMPLQIIGNSPTRQLGMAEQAAGDARVQAAFANLTTQAQLPAGPVRYRNTVAKSLRRRLPDGELLQFFSNPTAAPTTLALDIDSRSGVAVLLDAWTGTAESASPSAQGRIELTLPAYGARFLWIANEGTDAEIANLRSERSEIRRLAILDWTLSVDDFHHSGVLPGDWLTLPALEHSSSPGHYRATVTLDQSPGQASDFTLSLGQLYGAATVRVNGQDVGSVLLPPFHIEIGKALRRGKNEIAITLTPPRRNRIRLELAKGAPGWNAPDLGGRDNSVSAGLLGPVFLLESAPVSAP